MSTATSTTGVDDVLLEPKGLLIALWGLFGVTALIGRAIYALSPLAWEPLRNGQLSLEIGVAYGICVVAMAYAEGYRGFQLRFSPRVVARAVHLGNNPRWWRVLLAAPFCMGFFHANRRTLITAWSVTAGVVILVIAVSFVEQPWRGVIDAGVVVGLAWGLLSVWIIFANAMVTRRAPEVISLPRA